MPPETHESLSPLELTEEQKDLLVALAESDAKQLRYWEGQLENAKREVDRWKTACDHSSALSIRARMSSWATS